MTKKLIIIFFILLINCSSPEIDYYKPIEINFTGNDLVFFNLLNDYRLEHGLQKFKGERKITELSKEHAIYMFVKDSINHDYFWIRYQESGAKDFGEIVAYNFLTPASQLSSYQSSPPHNTILLNTDFKYIGIAQEGMYQCVEFAKYN